MARRSKAAATISDVARQAGVSPMTVSRVINNTPNVRPATRDLVDRAISALNYAPNLAARSLALAERNRIGLLYSNPAAGFVGEFLVGSLDQATRYNVQLIFEKCDGDSLDAEIARRLVEDGVDGVVLTPPLCEERSVLDIFSAAGIPAVLLGTSRSPGDQLTVAIDDRHAAFEMTAHIIALGHRRIGFIAGDPNLSASALRLRGYREALEAAKLPADEMLEASGRFTYRSGLEAAAKLLLLPERPTAIFACNDDMAAATVAAAHRHHLDVPADLTVCGFDDTILATATWPELTTIHQPIADMSRAAVELLVDVIRRPRGTTKPASRVLGYTLIRRHSDAAPRRPL